MIDPAHPTMFYLGLIGMAVWLILNVMIVFLDRTVKGENDGNES